MPDLCCWRCGSSLAELSLPLSRLDECPECRIELHVCRMCERFDASVVRSCREDDAEDVKEKERANFCDYFSPSTAAFSGDSATAGDKARMQLDSLFGGDAEATNGGDHDSPDQPGNPGDDLFK